MIKVFGHQSPDTDATGSAIIWSWYLNTHTENKAAPFVLGNVNSETTFVLRRWKLPTPALLEAVTATDEVVIVDTNNPQELPEHINEATILQIIDHHKLMGGLKTDTPPEITIRPLACTATVLYDLMGQKADTMPEEITGVMLSCILSDTLAFRSPTTTPHDKEVAEMLANKIGITIADHAEELFAAKSDISAFSDSDLITLDSKKFEVGDVNLRVSVVETTDPNAVLDRADGIVSAIKDLVAAESDVEEILFFVVDILQEEAIVFTYNQRVADIIEKSFNVSVSGATEFLPGIVSRKKQIIPSLKI